MNLTLFQLNNLVRETIESTLNRSYWVEAELAECRESHGHCYMELVQKDEDGPDSISFSTAGGNGFIAKARASCWRSTWQSVRPRFEAVTGQQLHAGMKVLLRVKAQFHEAYGFQWIVQDIDPNFTMGDMARRRQEIIQTLKNEGVFDLNKSLPIPMFAQRIAVISSATAAGYGDFCNQLISNDYGFQFRTQLFTAIMQGDQVEESVIAALNKINECIDDFDLVVIIRGGGSTMDLSGFDTLALAENVANFPLPIITGIGHDRDESILDMISCVKVKTPTAAADFLINNLATTLNRIEDAGRRITDHVRQRMEAERQRLSHIESYLPVAFSLIKTQEDSRLQRLSTRLTSYITQRLAIEHNRISTTSERIPLIMKSRLDKEQYRIDMLSQRVSALDPIHILRRGYAIALHNGKAIKSPNDVTTGDEISIMLSEGIIEAVTK